MVFYNVDTFGKYNQWRISVEDGSIEPFTIAVTELPERAVYNEAAFHAYVQGLISVRLAQAAKRDPCRLAAGRHDRGWPR